MTSLPRRVKILPRPADNNQDHHGAAGQLFATGRTRTGGGRSTGYLFVNKSQDSECLSNCKVDKTQTKINTHVQLFRPNTHANAPSNRDFMSRPTGETRTLYRSLRRRYAGAIADDGEGASSETETLDVLLVRSNRYGGDKDDMIPLYSNNFLEGDAFDPFCRTAVPIDKSTHNFLQYFLHLGWKAHLRNIGGADQVEWSESFDEVSSIVRGCLFNEMHLYAFLACIPKRMELHGSPSVGEIESPEVHMSRALRAMRKYFAQLSASPIDQHVILDIFFLSLSEFFRGDFAAMRIHLRMIRAIVDSLGGFRNVSGYIREVCCYTELCFALRTGEAPLFDMTWDPGPLQFNQILQPKPASWPSVIVAFGSGFENPLQEGFFDDRTRGVIEDLIFDIPVLEYVRNDAEMSAVHSRWACIRSRALLHRLLSLQMIGGQASCQELKAHCVIISLGMLMGYENLCVSPIRYPESVRARLVDALRSSNSDFSPQGNWGRHNDMLLWITITGIRVARGSYDEGWFMSRAIQGCRILGLESYDQLHSLVRKFIWVENYECPALTKLTRHILSAKAEILDAENRGISEES